MKMLIFFVFFIVRAAFAFEPRNHRNWHLLRHDICGAVSSDRIIGGTEVPMNSYPWIARIGYSSGRKMVFRCGGVVVNLNTVLTAGHCVANLPKDLEGAVIRLGEHNSETDPDCQQNFCADPVLDIPASEIIIPKNYDIPSKQNDIALIRLAKNITFSDFVKPICIPSGRLHRSNFVGSVGEVAGWGFQDADNPAFSKTLQMIKLKVVDNRECGKQPFYPHIGPRQMCVGGIVGMDSCNGDSGGPLMKVYDADDGPRYFLLGLVSFGPKRCGKTNVPAIYTRMSAFTKWVLDNVEKTTRNAVNVLEISTLTHE